MTSSCDVRSCNFCEDTCTDALDGFDSLEIKNSSVAVFSPKRPRYSIYKSSAASRIVWRRILMELTILLGLWAGMVWWYLYLGKAESWSEVGFRTWCPNPNYQGFLLHERNRGSQRLYMYLLCNRACRLMWEAKRLSLKMKTQREARSRLYRCQFSQPHPLQSSWRDLSDAHPFSLVQKLKFSKI